MILYAPQDWKKKNTHFPILITYETGILIEREVAKQLLEMYPDINDLSQLHKEKISADRYQINLRFDKLDVIAGFSTNTFIVKNSITKEKLYEFLNWDICQKEKNKRIRKKLSGNIFLKLLRTSA